MSEEYNYRLNCGQYVLHRGDTPIGAPQDTIAVALDCVDGTRHKHGPVESVEKWATEARNKLRQVSPELAEQIVVLSGRIPLEDLNKCLQITGYAGVLWRRAQAGQLPHEPLV